MKNIAVTIEGISPLLMHRFTETGEIAVQNGHRPVATGEAGTPRAQAEVFAYRNDAGELYLPGPSIFAAIVNAGKFHKHGKNKLTTYSTSLVPAGLLVTDLAVSLNTKNFEVDSRRVVNPSTRGAHICHRPRLDKWKTTFNIQWDDAYFPENLVRTLVDDAGSKIGVGAFRPEKKGPFGRFKVVAWKVT